MVNVISYTYCISSKHMYIFIHMHKQINMSICVYTYIHIYICIYMYIYIHMYRDRLSPFEYIYIYVCVCIWVCLKMKCPFFVPKYVPLRLRKGTSILRHPHTYIYIYLCVYRSLFAIKMLACGVCQSGLPGSQVTIWHQILQMTNKILSCRLSSTRLM